MTVATTAAAAVRLSNNCQSLDSDWRSVCDSSEVKELTISLTKREGLLSLNQTADTILTCLRLDQQSQVTTLTERLLHPSLSDLSSTEAAAADFSAE